MNSEILFLVISDIGGFLGLFLGASMLSIMEIVFFALSKILEISQRKNLNKTDARQDPEGSEKSNKIAEILAELRELKHDYTLLRIEMRENLVETKRLRCNDDEKEKLSVISFSD